MRRILRTLVLASLALGVLAALSAWWAYEHFDRSPSELIRYSKQRLLGHPKLEAMALPVLHEIQEGVERSVPEGALPLLGKGAQSRSPDAASRPSLLNFETVTVSSSDELSRAMSTARAGQVIEISPGVYRLEKSARTGGAGSAAQPIVLRASQPGSVTIESSATEGFVITEPFWVIENLVIRGVCKTHADCEHAIHVAGKARNTVIRNNRMEDFNAHIKVNGVGSNWPDDGLIQFNTLTNSGVRETHLPVTPIDIVGANRWRIEDNAISNFVKADGNRISYGIFMKGAGKEGRIERNLIVCSASNISREGSRVGLSFGGGGTGEQFCRDKQCAAEHTGGVAINNIVAHCNDFGIDVNRSNQTLIAHNTLINTSGIDIRRPPASGKVYGNLLDGRIRSRNDGWLESSENRTGSLSGIHRSADRLSLEWVSQPASIPAIPEVKDDFCGKPRSPETLPGALGSQACIRPAT